MHHRGRVGHHRGDVERGEVVAAAAGVAAGAGAPIEVEIWTLAAQSFGRFVAAVPPPLSIGTLVLADGRSVKGFLVEAEAAAGARDITASGGWRAYMAQAGVPA